MEKRIIVTAEIGGSIFKSEVEQIIKGEEAEQIVSCKRHIRSMLNEDGLMFTQNTKLRSMNETDNPHGGYIEDNNLFPFRTEKLNSSEPMVLHCNVGE